MNQKLKQEKKTRDVRNKLKQYSEAERDIIEGVSKRLRPLIDVQKKC